MTYDEWIFYNPADDEPEPCDCGEDDCTCAQDAADEKGDAEYHRMKDDEK